MTPRKEKALQALLVCRTRAEAAKAAGIGESTLRAYLQDAEFSAAYKHAAAGIMGLKDIAMMLHQHAKLTLVDYSLHSWTVTYGRNRPAGRYCRG